MTQPIWVKKYTQIFRGTAVEAKSDPNADQEWVIQLDLPGTGTPPTSQPNRLLAGWVGGDVSPAVNVVEKCGLRLGYWFWISTNKQKLPSQGYSRWRAKHEDLSPWNPIKDGKTPVPPALRIQAITFLAEPGIDPTNPTITGLGVARGTCCLQTREEGDQDSPRWATWLGDPQIIGTWGQMRVGYDGSGKVGNWFRDW